MSFALLSLVSDAVRCTVLNPRGAEFGKLLNSKRIFSFDGMGLSSSSVSSLAYVEQSMSTGGVAVNAGSFTIKIYQQNGGTIKQCV